MGVFIQGSNSSTHSSGISRGDVDFHNCWSGQKQDETLPETYFRHAMYRVDRGVAYKLEIWYVYSDPAVTILGEVIYHTFGERVNDK